MKFPLYCPNPRDPVNEKLLNDLGKLDWIERQSASADTPFLIIENGRLGVAGAQWPKVHPVFADFLSGAATFRRTKGGGTGQLVARAAGHEDDQPGKGGRGDQPDQQGNADIKG